MRTSAKLRITRMRMALRGIWPDGNPLRRTCDRVEMWILAALSVVFVIGAPLAAVVAAGYVYGAGIRAERASHLVTAILQADARPEGGNRATAPISWLAPDGGARLGRVRVTAGAHAGSTVRTWVDGSGRLVAVPPQGTELAREAAIAAVLATLALGGLLIGTAAVARLVLGRRRLAAWEADWRLTEARWAWQGGL